MTNFSGTRSMEFHQSVWFFRSRQWNSIELVIEISKRSALLHFDYELGWTTFLASGTPQQWMSRGKNWKNNFQKIIFPYLKINTFWSITLTPRMFIHSSQEMSVARFGIGSTTIHQISVVHTTWFEHDSRAVCDRVITICCLIVVQDFILSWNLSKSCPLRASSVVLGVFFDFSWLSRRLVVCKWTSDYSHRSISSLMIFAEKFY